MPLKGKYGTSFTPPPAEDVQGPGLLDTYAEDLANFGEDTSPTMARIRGFGAGALGGVKNLLGLAPAAVRGTTGVLAAEGGLSGAGIAGLGELGAETLEGSIFKQHPARTLARTGVAAGLGAVPFSAIFKPGQALASAGLGAGYSGLGEAAREVAAGEDLSPSKVLTSGAIGGGVGGVLSKFLGGGKVPVPAKAVEEPFIIEPTDRGFGARGRTNPGQPYGPKPIKPEGNIEAPYGPFQGEEGAPPYTGTPAEASGRVQKVMTREETQKSALEKLFSKAVKDKEKLAEQEQAALEIGAAKSALVPKTPKVSESISAPIPGGRERMTTSFGKPKGKRGGAGSWNEDEAGNLVNEAGDVIDESSLPPAGSKAREIYDAWLAKGIPEERAVSLAAQGIPPRSISPATKFEQSVDELISGPKPEVPTQAPVEAAPPSVAPEASVVEPPPSPLAKALGTAKQRPSKVQKFNKGVEDIVSKSEAPSSLITPIEPQISPVSPNDAELDAISQRLYGTNYDNLTSGQSLKVVKEQLNPSTPPNLENLGTSEPHETIPEQSYLMNLFRNRAEAGDRGVAETLPSNLERLGTSEPNTLIPEQASPMNLYRGRVEASGQNYNALQKMFKAGEVPNDVARLAGRAASREARAAQGANPSRPIEVPPAPSVPPQPTLPSDVTSGSWVQDALNEIKKFKGEESGAIDPVLTTRLGVGAAGALIGGATDPLGNRPLSMAAGGAAGFVSPDIAKGIMALSGNSGAISEALTNFNPTNLKETAQKIWQTLPQVQRFNYLADPEGIGANAVVGPYGSAVMGAIEHALSGDPRGLVALRRLANLKQYGQDLIAARTEAAQRIQHGEMGRMEGAPQVGDPNLPQKVLMAPGVMMTAGDVAARNVLMEAGFTEAEARRITLTSEPEGTLARSVANFGKGSSLAQLLLPFKRTPANIWEQGGQRLPGIGFASQASREVPDPMRQQLVQQGIGGVLGLGSAAVSSQLDPASARHVRRFASNFAGQYSLPVTMGMAAGQAIRSGKSGPAAGAIQGINDLPLPTTDTITQWVKYLGGEGPIPSGAMPKQIRDLVQGDQSATSLGTLPPLETLRIRRP